MKASIAATYFVIAAALSCWAQASMKPYAQMLVNETLLRHTELSALSMTAIDPATKENKVIASNVAATVGNQADGDDLKVLAGNQPVTEPDIANHRCHAVAPLHDTPGATIGTLRVGFARQNAGSAVECMRQVEKLRDELRAVIPSAQVLFDPFIVSNSPGDILAQRLTIQTLDRYPDVLVLAFHVTAPGETTNRVVGINQPKFLGRPSDEVDHEVARTGKMIVQLIPNTHRMETHMPLRAADGSVVGTLVTVYLWQSEDEAPKLISRSMQIRNELQSRIPSLAALLAREP